MRCVTIEEFWIYCVNSISWISKEIFDKSVKLFNKMYLLVDLEIEYLRKRKFPEGMMKINVSQIPKPEYSFSSLIPTININHCILGTMWSINIAVIASYENSWTLINVPVSCMILSWCIHDTFQFFSTGKSVQLFHQNVEVFPHIGKAQGRNCVFVFVFSFVFVFVFGLVCWQIMKYRQGLGKQWCVCVCVCPCLCLWVGWLIMESIYSQVPGGRVCVCVCVCICLCLWVGWSVGFQIMESIYRQGPGKQLCVCVCPCLYLCLCLWVGLLANNGINI